MANLKEIRSRISSVGSTMQITSAMKMVSAAKLKRAQDAITQMRPYAEKLREILVNISSTLEGSAEGVYSQEREVNKVLIVAIASNRGLCGAFNANIFKAAEKRIKECEGKDVQVYAIGKRSADYFTGKHAVFNSNTESFELYGPLDLAKRVTDLGKKGSQVNRYKGLGEMNPVQLWETTLDPNARFLLQVKVENEGDAEETFSTLMGETVEHRRTFIQDNALKVSNLDI